MTKYLCFFSWIICTKLCTAIAVTEGNPDCRTTVEIFPAEAITRRGVERGSSLHVRCFTNLPPPLLLVTSGFIASQRAAGQPRGTERRPQSARRDREADSSDSRWQQQSVSDGQPGSRYSSNELSKQQQPVGDGEPESRYPTNEFSKQQQPVSDGEPGGRYSANEFSSNLTDMAAKDGVKMDQAAESAITKTKISELLFPDTNGGHKLDRLQGHVKLSSAFHNKNISATVKLAESGPGLVTVFRESSVSCALSARAFYCSAVSCRTARDPEGDCPAGLEEMVVSPPVFVRGCESQPPDDVSEVTCSRMENFAFGPAKNAVRGSVTTTTVMASTKAHRAVFSEIRTKPFPVVKAHNRSFLENYYTTDFSLEDQARHSSFVIMSVSFAGGFIVGAAWAGWVEQRPEPVPGVQFAPPCLQVMAVSPQTSSSTNQSDPVA